MIDPLKHGAKQTHIRFEDRHEARLAQTAPQRSGVIPGTKPENGDRAVRANVDRLSPAVRLFERAVTAGQLHPVDDNGRNRLGRVHELNIGAWLSGTDPVDEGRVEAFQCPEIRLEKVGGQMTGSAGRGSGGIDQ